MSDTEQAVDDWAEEPQTEMPSVKLFGRWPTEDVAVSLVGLSRSGQSEPNSFQKQPLSR